MVAKENWGLILLSSQPSAPSGPPSILEVLHGTVGGTNVTVVTDAATEAGDFLVCFHGNDYYTSAGLMTPTGSAGIWAPRATGDLGENNSHLKIWTRRVTSGGAQTVTVSPVLDEEVWSALYVLRGVNENSPVIDAAGAQSASGTINHDAPSVAGEIDGLLLCGVISPTFGLVDYTGPAGMIHQTEEQNLSTMSTASQVLVEGGATGIRTFISNNALGYASASIVLRAT